MTDILVNILLGLITGLISGVVAGLYTAVIGAKYASFQENKREILKVLRSIHWDEKYIQGHEEKDLNRIWLASRDLLTMNQKAAGKLVTTHYGILIRDIQGNSDKNILSLEVISNFHEAVRGLRINKFELLKFWQ